MGPVDEHSIVSMEPRASAWVGDGCPRPDWIDGVPGLWRWLSVWLGGRAPHDRLRRLGHADRHILLASKDVWDHLQRLDASGMDMDWWRSVALVRAAATTLCGEGRTSDWKGCMSALFWDVGLPLLMHRRPYGIDGMGRLVHVPRARRTRHERALFGTDHQALGERGMTAWGLEALLPRAAEDTAAALVDFRAVCLGDLFQTLGHPEACMALGAPSAAWTVALVEAEACVHRARRWSADLGVPFVGADAVLDGLRRLPVDDAGTR